MERSLFDQAVAEMQQSAPQHRGVFNELFIQTGLADSLLWLVVGIAIGKFLL